MPVEPNTPHNLSDLFHSSNAAEPGSGSLNAQEIIRRSRRRRLPRRLVAGSVLSLAIVGIGVAGVSSLGGVSPWTSASSESADSATSTTLESPDDTVEGTDGSSSSDSSSPLMPAPAEKLNLCGGTLAEVAPNSRGLELTVDFPNAAVGATSVEGTVTLTNAGSTRVIGYTTASPIVTLSQADMVLWHSNGSMIALAVDVDLAPGESMSYAATFEPVLCDVVDDTSESFRQNLPAAPAGDYQLSAAIDLITDTGTELVSGPTAPVSLSTGQ